MFRVCFLLNNTFFSGLDLNPLLPNRIAVLRSPFSFLNIMPVLNRGSAKKMVPGCKNIVEEFQDDMVEKKEDRLQKLLHLCCPSGVHNKGDNLQYFICFDLHGRGCEVAFFQPQEHF